MEADRPAQAFEITVRKAGQYYVSCLTIGLPGDKIDVRLNDRAEATLVLSQDALHWATIMKGLGAHVFSLSEGEHTISFCGDRTVIPTIDEIRVGTTVEATIGSLAEFKTDFKVGAAGPISLVSKEDRILSEQQSMTTSSQSDPLYDFVASEGREFYYTFESPTYFTAGQSVTFETKGASNGSSADPVMYLYKQGDPSAGSWGDDDGGVGFNSRISVTIASTGYYNVLLRDYHGTRTYCDLWLNGSVYRTDAPISGTRVYCGGLNKTGNLNFFTSRTTPEGIYIHGDPVMYVVEGYPEVIRAYNDNYAGNGDWSWFPDSRVKQSFSSNMGAVILKAYGYYYQGETDVYAKCENSNHTHVMDAFPHFEADDAIESSDLNMEDYRCISWSGGVTNFYTWPPNEGSDWYANGDALEAFDNFYKNDPPRYAPGAWNYTRIGATASTSIVDLWRKSDHTYDDGYTHASVRKPGNDQHHGYDWESKLGDGERTFHPRNALESPGVFGSVDKHYIPTGEKTSVGSMESLNHTVQTSGDAVVAGFSAIRSVSLSTEEKGKLNELTRMTTSEVRQKFEQLYDAWKSTWSDSRIVVQSNPRAYAQSEQYLDFISLCKKSGKQSWPMIIEKYSNGDIFVMNAIRDLIYPGNEDLMDEVRSDNAAERYDLEGRYIISTLKGNWMAFCKKVLNGQL